MTEKDKLFLMVNAMVKGMLVFVVPTSIILGFFLLYSLPSVLRFEKKEVDLLEYRSTHFDPEYNEISRGFVSGIEQLNVDDIFENKGGNGFLSLISALGKDEYLCSGTCYCEEDNEIRRTSATISRGISFLVASLTSLIAIKKAEDYFSQHCKNELSKTCSLSSVKSEVNECKKITKSENSDSDDTDSSIRYWCSGHCIPKIFKRDETIKIARWYGCEELTREGEIELKSSISRKDKNNAAREKFIKDYMTVYCREESTEKYHYIYPDGWKDEWKTLTCCTAQNTRKKNPSVKCRKLISEW